MAESNDELAADDPGVEVGSADAADDVVDRDGAVAAATPSEPSTGDGQESSRGSTILLVAATLLAIVTVFSVWARVQLLDTDEWVNLSSGLLQEEEIQDALAVYLVDVVYTEGDVEQGIEDGLPADLQGLSGPLAGALRAPLTDGVKVLLASDAVQTSWKEANRRAHATTVAILKDDTGELVSTADGVVALELRSLVTAVGESVGISEDRLDQIPDDAGQIVIFESDELSTVQRAVQALEFLAWFLFILIVALYVLSVFFAPDRVAAVRRVGWSLGMVGIVVLATQAIATRAVIDAIVDDPGQRTTADVAAFVLTGLLRQMGWSLLIYGVLMVGFTSLLGTSALAVKARELLAPLFTMGTGGLVAGSAVIVLLLLWWSPGRAFESWTSGLVLIALVFGALFTLRTRIIGEQAAGNLTSSGAT